MMTVTPSSSQSSRATQAAAAAEEEATNHSHTDDYGGLGYGRPRNNNNNNNNSSPVKPKKKRNNKNKKKKKATLFDDDDDDDYDYGDKNRGDDYEEYDSVRGENLLLLEPTLPPTTTTTTTNRRRHEQDPDQHQYQYHQRREEEEEELLDIDEAIQRIGFGAVQVHTIVATGLLFVCDSMEIVLLSYLSNVATEGRFFDYYNNDNDNGGGGGGTSTTAATTTTSEAVVETVLEDTFGTVDGTDAADDDGSDPLLRTAVFPAAIAGAILFGVLGDLYGRRIVLVVTSVTVAVFGIGTSFVSTFQMLVLTRCAVSFGIGGMTVGFDLCAELLPPNKRGTYLAIIQIFWTVGALIAHLTLKFHHIVDDTGYDDANDDVEFDDDSDNNDNNNNNNGDTDNNGWRWIAGMFAIPGVLSFFVTVLLVPESPRWYLAKGRHDDALAILRKAAEVNRKDPSIVFPDGVMLFSHEYSQQHYRYSDLRSYNQDDVDRSVWYSSFSSYVSSCWSKSSLSQIFNVCSAGWMSITAALWTTYFGKAFLEHGGVSMAVDVFSYDDRQQEYQAAFTAASEFVGLCLVVCTVDRWGRSMTQMICYALSGILCLSLALFEDYDPSVNPNLLLGLVFFSHLLVHSGTMTTWIATTEVLATTIRTTGHGTAHAFTRIGGALSTFILSRIYSIPTVGLILFVTALWTASSASKLPETKVKDMGAVHYPDPSRSRRRRRRTRRRRQQQQQRQDVNTPTT